MANVQPRGDKFQLRVKHKLLTKPYYDTFDTEEEARAFGQQLESFLARGIVPPELLSKGPGPGLAMGKVLDNYLAHANGSPSQSDIDLIPTVRAEVASIRVGEITYQWVQNYVGNLKTKQNLAPGTIRKRVGLLARVIDWHHLETTGAEGGNSFRLLPRGYSVYTKAQAELAPDGAKVDIRRQRRLSPEELARVRAALSGVKAEGKERPLKSDPEFQMLFELIYGTGARLFEAYRARPEAFDLQKRWWKVQGSKGHRGAEKPRVVALRPALVERLEKYFEGREAGALMFSFWDGGESTRKKAQMRLTARFSSLFGYAKVLDFTEHDLRHSACCDWLEQRNSQGHWAFSEVEVAIMMGWTKLDMMLRYASFRAEDLASRLD